MPVDVIMPKVDMDMATGVVAAWHKGDGESVSKGEPLFDIETDKAAMEVESPATGTLQFIAAGPGDEVPIGATIGWIFAEGETLERPASALSETTAPAANELSAPVPQPENTVADPDRAEGVRATPLARRLAKEAGLDLASVAGSGPKGRVQKADIEAAQKLSAAEQAAVPEKTAETPSQTAAQVSKARLDQLGISYDTVPVDRMRATIAERLTESKSTVPHFYLQSDIRLDALLQFRETVNAALRNEGRKISINDLLVRASALALQAVPEANASWAGDEIIRYHDANISVAVAIEGGLMTPVVRAAQTKSISALSAEIKDLAEKAKSGKLSPQERQGGSFSISNLGMFGVRSFSAIINPPESMILAVGQAERRFVEDENGAPVGATLLSVTLSCDHRVVDGALGARWLNSFKGFLENPMRLTV